jgi:AcrR family transcriptional regulator
LTVDVDSPECAELPRRRRDAVATRLALLAAAREQIAEHGFTGTTTRDVAAAAGVNQALVYRYFGSREKLLAEAAGGDGSADTALDRAVACAPLADLPHILLEHALDVSAAKAGDRASSLATLAIAANDATFRALIRQRIEGGLGAMLARRLAGADAALRGELLAALVTGIVLLREKVGTCALSEADRRTLGVWIDLMAAPLLATPTDPAPADATTQAPPG